MKMLKKICGACLVALIAAACLESYAPPGTDKDVSFLVVDGFLNSATGNVSVKLTRAIPLDKIAIPTESSATITVEEVDGATFALHEDSAGYYSYQGIPVNASKNYRLHIRTTAGKEYVSDNVPILSTPPIDSVTWTTQGDEVVIRVNTHDPTNNSRYYQWTYDETWEYVAAFYSSFKLVNGQPMFRDFDEQIYRCWKTMRSTRILINSSIRLSEDRIDNFAINTIPLGAQRISIKYSVLVHQRTLTREAYEFWQELQKTTETLGGLFDPLPSQVTGNVHNLSDAAEPVLGYFSAGEEKDMRIFISHRQLPSSFQIPQRYPNCVADSIPVGRIATLGSNSYILSSYGQPFTIGYLVGSGSCANCILSGGKNVEPPWWQ